MTDNALIELAARCEAAEGPDRELDRDIAGTIGMCLHSTTIKTGAQSDTGFDCVDCGADSWGNRSRDGFNRRLYDPFPAYTASLDAALTLKPEGWAVTLDVFPEEGSKALLFDDRVNPVRLCNQEADAATPALALTAAALRARATTTDAPEQSPPLTTTRGDEK